MSTRSHQLRLARRPHGPSVPQDFEIVEVPLAAPGEGEVVVENLWVSVDPYHRQVFDTVALGAPLEGRALGRVLDSRDPGIHVGDVVLHRDGLRTHAVTAKARVIRPEAGVPLEAHLGILGGTGLSAWVGLTTIGGLEAGESVLITAAGGGVGTAAGHIARALGASTIIGVTGSRAKAERLLSGPFDEVIVYRDTVLADELAGRDVQLALDGVGGDQLEAVIGAMAVGGRISWVGGISGYTVSTPPIAPRNLFDLVHREISLHGFLVRHHLDERERYEAFMTPLVADRTVPVEQTVVDGLEAAPSALSGLLSGANYGKHLVRLAE
ncbi:NADP-dependent oxidoreductase [Brachybacterium ginsengisoli]|uniref:NADP-dependent oxidoreductase n=1 Tax=Brachybacterium ginsengisoli TaxID=1331682 RepID=A0A291GXZ3_9MICO|nr:NADP-dependent oxidoreductase [Brachybacterium ginsengisoli]ATG55002.1 NADP-dependent oxidoreductase [Brachybacterium ginsengisoli]